MIGVLLPNFLHHHDCYGYLIGAYVCIQLPLAWNEPNSRLLFYGLPTITPNQSVRSLTLASTFSATDHLFNKAVHQTPFNSTFPSSRPIPLNSFTRFKEPRGMAIVFGQHLIVYTFITYNNIIHYII